MAARSSRLVLLTDATLGENRFPKGTGFTVVDKLPARLGEGEVDKTTARLWRRLGWAVDQADSAKGARGGHAD